MSCTVGRPKRSSVYLRGSSAAQAQVADQLADFFTPAALMSARMRSTTG
jgi:hypothetical protein